MVVRLLDENERMNGRMGEWESGGMGEWERVRLYLPLSRSPILPFTRHPVTRCGYPVTSRIASYSGLSRPYIGL